MTVQSRASATTRTLTLVPSGALIAAAAVGLLLFAARFWLHDAFPYVSDYTESSYRRYWPNRMELLFHIAGGTIALFAGPFQLWSGLRRAFPQIHRAVGYAYIAAIVVAASSSFYLSFHTRPDFGLSLFILAIVWLTTTGMALMAVRNRRFDAHQEWMIRSYIATFSFASYRYLVALSVFKGLGPSRNAMVLWISWVVPMMLYEVYLQRDRVRPLKRPASAPAKTL